MTNKIGVESSLKCSFSFQQLDAFCQVPVKGDKTLREGKIIQRSMPPPILGNAI